MRKVTVNKWTVRGEKQWVVSAFVEGKRTRAFFSSSSAAETHASKLRGDAVGVRQLLAAIPQSDQEKLVMIYNEAKRRGIDIMAFMQPVSEPVTSTAPSLSSTISDMAKIKRQSGHSDRYVDNLEIVLNDFAKGRESLAVDKIGLSDVEAFLKSKRLAYRKTLRSRLSALFNFAIRREYRLDNPCTRLEAIKITPEPPHIFTLDQVEKLLAWFKKNPRCLAWFILTTFAGLRPEEAQKTSWQEINFDEQWIKIEAQTTKPRQRRVVYPKLMVFSWLWAAKKLKTQLPVPADCLKEDRIAFRTVAGFTEWPKDITRHTAASMWLAQTGDAAKVALACGHSERTLKRNYMALVTKVAAERFWKL